MGTCDLYFVGWYNTELWDFGYLWDLVWCLGLRFFGFVLLTFWFLCFWILYCDCCIGLTLNFLSVGYCIVFGGWA